MYVLYNLMYAFYTYVYICIFHFLSYEIIHFDYLLDYKMTKLSRMGENISIYNFNLLYV